MRVVGGAVTSPWFYAVLFTVALVDGFFPVVPSESLVVTAGVYAASGEPSLPVVVVVAAAGAFVGDHVSCWVGRRSGGRWERGLPVGSRRRSAFDRAGSVLAERGGVVLVVARYVPGGRTAVTLTMGATGYPAGRFAFFAAVAAVSWGGYSALVGYVGGAAFKEDPLRGLLLGLGLAVSVAGLAEAVRWVRRRRERR
ncbi:DedA family protein [Actinomadura craniellae]|uniref:DedA family protein n=2 Tax=Actinomadura craniellae TaxID=2231787 RepID=A0A365H5A4_9ACTN|nr:DedA family protein [Actinomadura craniellae]